MYLQRELFDERTSENFGKDDEKRIEFPYEIHRREKATSNGKDDNFHYLIYLLYDRRINQIFNLKNISIFVNTERKQYFNADNDENIIRFVCELNTTHVHIHLYEIICA